MPPSRAPSDELLHLALAALRVTKEFSQKDLEQVAGLAVGVVSKLEGTKRPLQRDQCEELAVAMGYRRSAVDHALAFVAKVLADAAASGHGEETGEVDRLRDAFVADRTRAAEEFSRGFFDRMLLLGQVLEAKRRAPGLLARLLAYAPEERLALVREVAEFQDWALSVLLCDASEEAAPDSADEAAALAELALEVARRVPGDPGWRQRVEGNALMRRANAWRVAGDHGRAAEACERALRLWEAGATTDPGILDEVRMLDLEASLRQNQPGRLAEALDLLERALAMRPAAEVEGRLLIKKGCTLENLGRYDEAIAVLELAAPLVEAGSDARLRFAWRFNRLVNICALGRHAEAESRLGEIRLLASRLGKALDLVRLTWLEARIAAGLGRVEEALAAFERVRAEFTTRRIAYDTALVLLDIAALLAERGRSAELERLAQQSRWIFETPGVHREALRAVGIFCEAADEKRVTVELVRNIADYLRRARHDPELRFEDAA